MATNTIPPIKVPAMPPRDCVNNKTNKAAVVATALSQNSFFDFFYFNLYSFTTNKAPNGKQSSSIPANPFGLANGADNLVPKGIQIN